MFWAIFSIAVIILELVLVSGLTGFIKYKLFILWLEKNEKPAYLRFVNSLINFSLAEMKMNEIRDKDALFKE